MLRYYVLTLLLTNRIRTRALLLEQQLHLNHHLTVVPLLPEKNATHWCKIHLQTPRQTPIHKKQTHICRFVSNYFIHYHQFLVARGLTSSGILFFVLIDDTIISVQ